MKVRSLKYALLSLVLLAGCGDQGPWLTARTFKAVTQAPSQEIVTSFDNPFYSVFSGTTPFKGQPLGITMPSNVNAFYLRVDGAPHLTNKSAAMVSEKSVVNPLVYNLRLASVMVMNDAQDQAYNMGANRQYFVPAGSTIYLVPYWQSVTALNIDIEDAMLAVPVHLAF